MPHSDWKHVPKELTYTQYVLLIHSSMRGIRTQLSGKSTSIRRLRQIAENDIQKYVDTEKHYGFGEEYADDVRRITVAIIALWDAIAEDADLASRGVIPPLQPCSKYRLLISKIKEELR